MKTRIKVNILANGFHDYVPQYRKYFLWHNITVYERIWDQAKAKKIISDFQLTQHYNKGFKITKTTYL